MENDDEQNLIDNKGKAKDPKPPAKPAAAPAAAAPPA